MATLNKGLVDKAAAYRKENPSADYLEGYVVFFDAKAIGWTAHLHYPKSWMPGTIAIGPKNQQFVARGGDEYNGADRWEALPIIT